MPSISLQVLRTGDPEGALRPGETVAMHDNGGHWRAVLIEHGMSSGQPSVALIVPMPGDDDGAVIVLETSLLAIRAAARGLEAMAETRLGWTLPA